MNLEKAILGCILGTTLGDALGLPYEALSLRKQRKLIQNNLKHRLIFGHGMISDDTEHLIMVAQSLIVAGGDEMVFGHWLSWQLRLWLLTLPAGIGWATLRSILKLWLGFSLTRSGVFSAGNGAAMRSPLIGICYGNNHEKLHQLVCVSTRMTHTDPKAEYGAMAVAIASHLAAQDGDITPDLYYQKLTENIPEAKEFLDLMKSVIISVKSQENSSDFAKKLGLEKGISGYIYHTIPLVIHVWLTYPEDYAQGIETIIKLGGDTDTTAAILGGIIGARVGKKGIPNHWLNQLWLYPFNLNWLEKLAQKLTQAIYYQKPQKYLTFPIHGLWLRNIIFFLIVIGHLVYRLFL